MADRNLVTEFESFAAVLNGCASYLSADGIFLQTTQAAEVGSEMAFEVRVRDGFSVLRGEGEIVSGTNEGVCLRFVYLDQPSRKLLPKILEHYAQLGIPSFELPAAEVIEVETEVEEQVAEEADIVEEAFDNGGQSEEEIPAAETPVGLTLDDLEAEFLNDQDSGDDEGEDSAPDDIHLDELLTDDRESGLETAEESETDALQVDSGLSWLPDEPEKEGRRSLWITLLLIVLAAALGAAFYYYILRPRAASSWRPVEPVEVQARALPAAASIVEPAPTTTAISETAADVESETAPDSEVPADPVPETPRSRPPDPPASPLTGVDRITWVDASGETVITIWGDGLFAAEQVDDFRVDGGAPREVVRVRGVGRFLAERQIELDSAHVRRIRIGLHQEADGPALHFVADLVDGEVELLRTETAGEQLRVYFSKAG